MIYKNPKSIINKYVSHMNHHHLSELELYNKLTHSFITINQDKNTSPESLENEYLIEYYRKKLRKTRSNKAILYSKLNSLTPTSLDPNSNKICENPESSLKRPSSKQSLSPRHLSKPFNLGHKSIRFNSARRLNADSTKANTSSSTPSNQNLFEFKNRVKIIPKNKSKAMHSYYDTEVRRNHFPVSSYNKRLEANLRSFSSEKLKTFKDFKVVKLFK